MPPTLLGDDLNTQPSQAPAGDFTTLIEINMGVGAFHCIFLASDNPLLSFAGRTSNLNPPATGYKVKRVQSESFMVVGHEHSSSARAGIGSLLLAALSGPDIVYVGLVGNRFKERDAQQLRGLRNNHMKSVRFSATEDGRIGEWLYDFHLFDD